MNTLRVDGEIFESGKKKLRIQKYLDMWASEPWCTTFLMEMSFSCLFVAMQIISFTYERLCSRTCFQKEGKTNLEIAHSFVIFKS